MGLAYRTSRRVLPATAGGREFEVFASRCGAYGVECASLQSHTVGGPLWLPVECGQKRNSVGMGFGTLWAALCGFSSLAGFFGYAVPRYQLYNSWWGA
jgi:hypothetical protein